MSCNSGVSCDGVHCVEIDGLVSVERWSCNRGASCVVKCTIGRFRAGLCREVVL